MKTFLSKTAVAAALLVLVGAGCGSSRTAPPESPSAANPLAGIPCPYDDKDLCRFMMNWKEAPSYSSTMTSQEPGEPAMTTDVKQSGGGARSSMLSKQGGKEISHMITIDGTTYMRDYEADVWWKFPPQQAVAPGAAVPEIDVEYTDDGEIAKDETVYEKQGKEACGDRTCFKYKVTDPSYPEVSYWWFDDRDYMMRKMRTESANGGYFEMVITPGNVTVDPPAGTIKEMGANPIDPFGQMTDEEKREYEQMQADIEKYAEEYDIPTE